MDFIKIKAYCITKDTIKKLKKTTYRKKLFFKDFIYLFLEKGEGKEKKRERNIDVGARDTSNGCPLLTPSWDLAHSPGMCLTGNKTCDPSIHRLALNPLSHSSQGNKVFFKDFHQRHLGRN